MGSRARRRTAAVTSVRRRRAIRAFVRDQRFLGLGDQGFIFTVPLENIWFNLGSNYQRYAASLFQADFRGCEAFSGPAFLHVFELDCWTGTPREPGEEAFAERSFFNASDRILDLQIIGWKGCFQKQPI